MKGGWLEHEIRSLPQVLACSVSGDDVVVMVQPSADPAAVEQAVQDVLQRYGIHGHVRVYGGDRPAYVEQPVKVRDGRRALIGSIGGAAILAAGVWIAGATSGLRGPKTRAPAAAPAEPPERQVVVIPVVGGAGGTTPLPAQEGNVPQLLKPVHRPVLVTGSHQAKRPSTSGRQPARRRARPPGDEPAPAPQRPAPKPCNGPLDPLLALTGPRLTPLSCVTGRLLSGGAQ